MHITERMKRSTLLALLVAVVALFILILLVRNRPSSTVDPNSPLAQEVKKSDFVAQALAVTGVVTGVDLNEYTITIKATILDLSGASEQIIPALLPAKEVVYQVIMDDLTMFEGEKGLDGLVPGDEITVISGISIYEAANGEIHAQKIIFLDKEISATQALMGYQDVLIGSVRSMNKSQGTTKLVVEVEVPDSTKLSTIDPSGSFEVPYVTKQILVTVPIGIDTSGIKSGRMVRVETEENVYATESVTAKAITLME